MAYQGKTLGWIFLDVSGKVIVVAENVSDIHLQLITSYVFPADAQAAKRQEKPTLLSDLSASAQDAMLYSYNLCIILACTWPAHAYAQDVSAVCV